VVECGSWNAQVKRAQAGVASNVMVEFPRISIQYYIRSEVVL